MKDCIKLLVLFFAIGTYSCSGDEEKEPSFEFINQDAAGKINNVSWSYADGLAVVFSKGRVTQVSVSLALKQDKAGCDMDYPVGDWIFFGVPSVVGLYKLSSDGDDSYEVQLNKGDGLGNFIAKNGVIEILSISDTKVSGRLNVKYDNKNYVNGNFIVSICP